MAPSLRLGLTPGSYEAYCLDEAVWYLGTYITQEVDKVGHKPAKGEANAVAAKKRKLDQLLGDSSKQNTKGFADPAAFFS